MWVLAPWGALWGSPTPGQLLAFLHGVRAMVRGSAAVAVVSLPTYHMPGTSPARALHTAHTCFRLEAFKGATEWRDAPPPPLLCVGYPQHLRVW